MSKIVIAPRIEIREDYIKAKAGKHYELVKKRLSALSADVFIEALNDNIDAIIAAICATEDAEIKRYRRGRK